MSFSLPTDQIFVHQSSNAFVTNSSGELGSIVSVSPQPRSLLIIDAGVADTQTLISGAVAGAEIYQLSAQQDGIAQITALLAGQHDIASLQIVSHGKSGGLRLGESWLDLPNLPRYVNQLKSWGQALTSDADILLYGCNVAAGETGRSFVNLLAQTTGADIAASDDLTGNAALGGNWDLEVQTGTIDTSLGLSTEQLWEYDSILDPRLVKDIATGLSASDPDELTNVGGILYFSAMDAIHGRELWKSDGTAAGTVLVKDINLGGNNSNPSSLTNINGLLYFTAENGINGAELWKSDGTEVGTVLVQDIARGRISSTPSNFFNFDGNVYFSADDGIFGRELWKSDGTETGTLMLRNIALGNGYSSNPSDFINLNGKLYFSATDGSLLLVNQLWKTDGTENGTLPVQNLNPIPYVTPNFANSTKINDAFYFTGNIDSTGYELWKTDGTESGTVIVKDIIPGRSGSLPRNLIDVNSTLYFTSYGELWKSDGTANGTTAVKSFNDGNARYGIGSNLTNVNGTIYFRAYEPLYGDELWKSDGTSEGTSIVKDIHSRFFGVNGSNPDNFIAVDNTLYFTANDGLIGNELWKSDGTEAGTIIVKDIFPGTINIPFMAPPNSSPSHLTNVNGNLYFTADNGENGRELWILDASVLRQPRSEIFWRNSQTNLSVVWNQENTTQLVAGRLLTYGTGANLAGKPVIYDRSWRLVNTVDLNGDRIRDLVYARDGEIRVLTVGQVNGQTTTVEADREFTFTSTKFGSLNGLAAKPGSGWELVGVEDMTGDGQGDFVFYSRGLDRTVIWTTNKLGQIVDGGYVTSIDHPGGQKTGAPNEWTIQSLGDFTGDGKTDILWRNTQNTIVLWAMNGTQLDTTSGKSGVLSSLGRNFQVKGVGDFNDDGVKDIVWRDQTNNINRIWTFGTNGRPTEVNLQAAASSHWEIGDVADMNGDGTTDLIWRNNAENNVVIWNIKAAALSLPGSGYLLNYLPGGNQQVINPGGTAWKIDAVTAI